MTPTVRLHLASALTGVLAGALYQLFGVASPAPPWVALTGLLGLLLGERGMRGVMSRIGCCD
ncbi:DUF1427 family protein [Streptomyces sp. NPDC127084]|uniref:DUF1427 family protein n=1 Tax=Streptomyces sp. NPDC127084 TaxID=3347133 RepID=UPI00364C8BE7